MKTAIRSVLMTLMLLKRRLTRWAGEALQRTGRMKKRDGLKQTELNHFFGISRSFLLENSLINYFNSFNKADQSWARERTRTRFDGEVKAGRVSKI